MPGGAQPITRFFRESRWLASSRYDPMGHANSVATGPRVKSTCGVPALVGIQNQGARIHIAPAERTTYRLHARASDEESQAGQPGHLRKVRVARVDGQAVLEGDRGDPEVVGWDGRALARRARW